MPEENEVEQIEESPVEISSDVPESEDTGEEDSPE